MPSEPLILVVDDQPINVQLLQYKLKKEGMEVMTANNGQEALDTVQERLPDVILLDIMMPGIDGLEVCRRLQQDEHTRDVPIIFITARTTKEGKLEGLGVGAADYLVKPIDLEEMVARVRTQLRIREGHRQNLELSARLAEARRHSALAHMTEGIAHNLNNLLGIVSGYLNLLPDLRERPEKFDRSVSKAAAALDRMVHIVGDLTAVAESERPQTHRYATGPLLHSVLDAVQTPELENCPIVRDIAESLPELETNRDSLEIILERLLANAREAYPESLPDSERPIEVSARVLDELGVLELLVADRGAGLDPETQDHVFEAFVSSKAQVGRGMGLTIVRHSIRSLGGEIRLERREGGGVVAVVHHPLANSQAAAHARDAIASAGEPQ